MLFGGYPVHLNEAAPNGFDVVHVWFAGHLESVSQGTPGMRLRIADSLGAGPDGGTPHTHLGGWSGGAVFRVLEHESIAKLELAGIIYEYTSGSEVVLAHPLTSIAPDGTFRG
jgi:hypothetical protein